MVQERLAKITSPGDSNSILLAAELIKEPPVSSRCTSRIETWQQQVVGSGGGVGP